MTNYQIEGVAPFRTKLLCVNLTSGTDNYTLQNATLLQNNKIIGIAYNKNQVSPAGKAVLPSTAYNSAFLTIQDTYGNSIHEQIQLALIDTSDSPNRSAFWFEPAYISWENSKITFGNASGLTGGEAFCLQIYYQA